MRIWPLLALLTLLLPYPAAAKEAAPRLFVLTDIGNEPDDPMSLVRLLVYAKEIEIEGIAATTSVCSGTRFRRISPRR